MSGTDDPVRDPQDNAEWARATDARIAALENSAAVRVGAWVLSTSKDGHLIASYVDGGSVVLARKPSGGENDPDSIDSGITPACTITLKNNLSIATRGPVTFDGVLAEVGGNWTGGSHNITAMTVPVAGVYGIAGVMQINGVHVYTDYGCGITINGTVVAGGVYGEEDMSGGHISGVSAISTIVMPLNSGDAIGMEALVSAPAPGTSNIGTSGRFTPSVPTTLSAWLIAKAA